MLIGERRSPTHISGCLAKVLPQHQAARDERKSIPCTFRTGLTALEKFPPTASERRKLRRSAALLSASARARADLDLRRACSGGLTLGSRRCSWRTDRPCRYSRWAGCCPARFAATVPLPVLMSFRRLPGVDRSIRNLGRGRGHPGRLRQQRRRPHRDARPR